MQQAYVIGFKVAADMERHRNTQQPLFYRFVSISIVHPTQPRGNRPKLKKGKPDRSAFHLIHQKRR